MWGYKRLQDMLMVTAILLLLSGYSLSASAAVEQNIRSMTLDQVDSGRLLWKSQAKGASTSMKAPIASAGIVEYLPATLLDEDVALNISGLILTATLKQRFKNDTEEWLEAVYAFPLPEDAALYHMEMKVGDRLITGKIKEKSQAKKIYQRAKKAGKKAALVEQHRPNLFTNNIANIPPGEMIEVTLKYNQVVSYDQGEFELRFPLTTTPRYFPGVALTEANGASKILMNADTSGALADQIKQQNALPIIDTATGWSLPTTQVLDAHLISPFTVPLNAMPDNTHKVRLTVDIDAGFSVDNINSTSHQIDTQPMKGLETTGSHFQVALNSGKSPMDRDFVLTWQPRVGAEPKAALFTETWEGDQYSLLMVMPPQHLPEEMILPREQIFIIDTSGSMGGESIRQARASLEKALQSLKIGDRFNVIEFNSSTHALFRHSVPATPQKIAEARNYVRSLRADGGTEMSPALSAGLSGQVYPGYLRQVIFITDGSVGNEAALFAQIQHDLGESRLFTIGIGSAPNSYFMRKAAEFGRGSFTYIGDLNEVEVKLEKLFEKLRAPVLSDLSMNMQEQGSVQLFEGYPARMNDLYLGEPLIQVIKHSENAHQVQLSANSVGMYQSQTPLWEQSINLKGAKQAKGIATYWGRQKIESLMDSGVAGVGYAGSSIRQNESTEQLKARLRQEVIDVALKHHLVSPYTSLVAVEEVVSRPEGAGLKKDAVPQLSPKGSVAKMARLPQTATSSQLYMLIGFICYMLSVGLFYQQKTTVKTLLGRGTVS